MNKLNKRAFTLVELLVVIAILAVLATAAIIGYSSFIEKANVSNDNTVVTELNRFTDAYIAGEGKVNTVTDIAEELKTDGFLVSTLKPAASKDLYAFNINTKKFLVIDTEDVNALPTALQDKADIFVLVGSEKALEYATSNKLSMYLQTSYTFEVTLDIEVGLDVGEVTGITTINYDRHEATSKLEVVIRTNSYSTVLTIDSEYDTVTHYGKANNIDVVAVDNNNCYNEHGDVLGNINLKQGKVVVHEGCKAAAVVIDMTAAELASVTTLSADNSKEPTVPIILNTSQVLWNANPNNNLINPTTNNIIYTTMGGTLPENFENMTKEEKEAAIAAVEDVILGEAAIGSTCFETLAQAFSSVKTNETIVMLKDVTVSGSYLLVNNKNVTLDLSQHTLTSSLSYGFYVYSGSPKFTLKNGIVNSTDCIVYAKHNAEVFLDNIDITTTNDSSIYAYGSSVITVGSNAIVRSSTTGNYAATYINENATINVYGKMIRTAGSGRGFAIVGNGTNGHLQNTTINIYDGAYIEASDTIAIYNPQRGTVNVHGGKIEAYYSCIGIKSGSLNIFGGELKSTWNSEIERGSVPSSSSGGIDTNGSCIQIDSNTSYAGQMNVNITGGNFISEYAYIICETGNVNGSNVVSVRISNATATSHFENLILSTVASGNLTNDASWTIGSVSE